MINKQIKKINKKKAKKVKRKDMGAQIGMQTSDDFKMVMGIK